MMKVQTGSLLAMSLAMTVLAGCGDDKESKSAGTSAAVESKESAGATGVEDGATTATPVSAGQLDFFTERYISSDERLLRRQNRIEEELSGSAKSGQS